MKPKIKKPIPFAFILDELQNLDPYTKPMFGCTAVYVGEKIVFILRDRESSPDDRGVWLATTPEHHKSLKADFLSMRSIALFGPGVTGWQVLPVDHDDFEESVMKACQLVINGDKRIGKIPKSRLPKKSKKIQKKKVPKIEFSV